jgi:hypothetical protein
MATRTKKKYEDNAFTNLVKAIDAKWGHTYIEPEDAYKINGEFMTIDEMLEDMKRMEEEDNQ